MSTVSPMRASFASSWALNLVVKRMTRLYSRWRARRSTDTTIVLSIRSLTTRPTLVFRLPCTWMSAPVIAWSPSGRLAELAALALHGQDPRDCSPRLRDAAVVLELACRQREARSPEVLLRLSEGGLELGVGQLANGLDVHQ